MYRSLITVRYAKALFLKAQEDEILDDIIADIRFVHHTFDKHPEILTVINHPVTYTSQKKNVIHAIFIDKIHPITLDFLLLIVKNHREYYFRDIFRNFVDFYNDTKGIKTVELTTAVKVGDEERADMKAYIQKAFQAREISFTEKVNPEIIGGFIIQIEDKLLDVSVRKQLNKIRHDLMNNKENYS